MGAFWNEQRDREYANGHGVSLEKAAQERQHKELMRSLDNLRTSNNSSIDNSLSYTNEERKAMVDRYMALKEAQLNYRPSTVGRAVKFIGAMLVLPAGIVVAQALDMQLGAGIFVMFLIWLFAQYVMS